MATYYCPYCGGTNLIPHPTWPKYWKCLDCGRLVIKPGVIPDAAVAQEQEAPAE